MNWVRGGSSGHAGSGWAGTPEGLCGASAHAGWHAGLCAALFSFIHLKALLSLMAEFVGRVGALSMRT